ncbi:MAG: hypothetical protein ACOVP8_14320, partial [Phycisphaerales bacterium]
LPALFQFSHDLASGPDGLPVRYTIASFASDVSITDGNQLRGGILSLSGGSAFDAGGRVRLADSVAASSLFVNGLATLGGSAPITITSAEQTYTGDVDLAGDVTLAGGAINVQRAINREAGSTVSALTIAGEARLAGSIGAIRAIDRLTIDRPTVLGGGSSDTSVVTRESQTYNARVTLASDVTMRAGEGDTGGEIRVRGAIDSDDIAARDLHLRVGDGGAIRLGTSLGAVRRLDALTTQTVTGTPAPRASIIGESDIALYANSFAMTQGDKLTGLGSVLIDAITDAVLSDVSTRGDLKVDAASISLLRRPASPVLGASGTLVTDNGTDLVARGTLTLRGSVQMVGDGAQPAVR